METVKKVKKESDRNRGKTRAGGQVLTQCSLCCLSSNQTIQFFLLDLQVTRPVCFLIQPGCLFCLYHSTEIRFKAPLEIFVGACALGSNQTTSSIHVAETVFVTTAARVIPLGNARGRRKACLTSCSHEPEFPTKGLIY